MAEPQRTSGARTKARTPKSAVDVVLGKAKTLAHATALAEASSAGLLQGEKTEHFSFRATPALIEAAKRETGMTSTTDLGILALAILAQPDPVGAFMKSDRGRLGASHTLEY